MREILFRGKDPETGEWYEGQYIHLHKTTYCFDTDYAAHPDNDIHQIVFERMTDWCLPNRHLRADVDPATVGQYTGLKDKNGKRIFEGDVVQKHSVPMEVVFDAESAQFIVRYELDGHEHCFENTLCGHDLLTVIGNIHDNPELAECVEVCE